MAFENAGNNAFALLILAAFFLVIYTKMKNQTFKETFNQIKEVFGGGDG